jgi:lipid-binding SYLF domain-containing protein
MYPALRIRKFLFLILAAVTFGASHIAAAKGIDEEATAALKALYAQAPGAKGLGEKARAVLVFPSIRKAALLIGGQGGKGAMFQDGRIVGHYNIGGIAVGLEGGAQTYSYALFFMSDEAMERMKTLEGYELGVDPNIVVLNAAAGTNISTTTGQRDVYGYVYNASGLMGGVSLQGLKITKLSK